MALYPALYAKFAALQDEPASGPRLVYPVAGPPSLAIGAELGYCAVGIPAVRIGKGTIGYGPFVLQDDEFGRYAITRLALASVCVLGAKISLLWRNNDALAKWIDGKQDPIRASYAANMALDALARTKIQRVEGAKFYQDVISPADLLCATLLPGSGATLPAFSQAMLAKAALGVPPAHIPHALHEIIAEFVSLLVNPGEEWEHLEGNVDSLYALTTKMPGRWHTIYLPYSNPAAAGSSYSEIFCHGTPDRAMFERFAKKIGITPDWAAGDDLFFEASREKQRTDRVLARLSRACKSANLGAIGFPACDYARYSQLHNDLAPQIRRMIEGARLVQNVLDESAFEQCGSVDLQAAIQAVASEAGRNDVFVRDENLLKNESWAIMVDASLSLGGLGRQLRSIAVCMAETAKEIIGQNPWGMFAFSDDLHCIKDFSEPYDDLARSRIGGLVPDGLSHIPDALRLGRNLVLEHAKERNYIILISDGLPSGYAGIDAGLKTAIKELYSCGVTLAAIGLGSSRIKHAVPNARLVGEPAEMAKAFSELYFALSS